MSTVKKYHHDRTLTLSVGSEVVMALHELRKVLVLASELLQRTGELEMFVCDEFSKVTIFFWYVNWSLISIKICMKNLVRLEFL